MLPESHQGTWAGPNRLWIEDPTRPEQSDGRIEIEPSSISYSWSFRGEPQSGRITFAAAAAAIHASWTDTWHASDGMELHGSQAQRCLRLFGAYPAGEDVEWGWIIDADFRDPEHVLLRMFNVPPGQDPVIAVDLRAARS